MNDSSQRKAFQSPVFVVVLLVAIGGAIAWWRFVGDVPDDSVQKSLSPVVMGTTCRLIVVGPAEEIDVALEAALSELQEVDRLMSTYDPDSELSRFNRAAAGVEMPLSEATLSVLRSAEEFSEKTGGAFDATMRPLGRLWRTAAERGTPPSEIELASIQELVGFEGIEIGSDSASKKVEGLEVSLDAIAKGYAIDRAMEAMRENGMAAGLVDVGGDVRCFGTPRDAPAWRCGLQDPWSEGLSPMVLTPEAAEAGFAVCTSGDYRRFVTIGEKRYSHIVDPRTGTPTETAASVTVVAGDAQTADAWATALSVLGPSDGLALVEKEPGVEAMLITGESGTPTFHRSSGFERFVLAGE